MAEIRVILSPEERKAKAVERMTEASDHIKAGRFDDADRVIMHANHEGIPAVELYLEIVALAVRPDPSGRP